MIIRLLVKNRFVTIELITVFKQEDIFFANIRRKYFMLKKLNNIYFSRGFENNIKKCIIIYIYAMKVFWC